VGPAPFEHFLMGYLTAFNTIKDDTYNAIGPMPLADALGWISGYCQAHKLDSFERAIMQFVDAHYDARLRRAPGAPTSWGHPANTP
jgi:hypothetical protein